MIKVNIINNYNSNNYKKLFNKLAKVCSKLNKVKEKRILNVVICDNAFIHEYNLKYRNIDKETDVLSFPSDYENELGDIIISFERVVSQAKDYSHSEEREIGFLFTHGMLHCLGYDHVNNKEEEKIMFDMQNKILDEIGLVR